MHTPPLSPHLSFIILFLIGSAGHTKYEICVVLFLQGADNYYREERSTYTFYFNRPSVGHDVLTFWMRADLQRWEFMKENKKVRKKERKILFFFLVDFLVESSVFSFLCSFFLDHFLGRERVFFLFFLISFLVESVFSCFLL